jgi:Xaa-Pro aminopeptidase
VTATFVPSYSLRERDRRWGLARSFLESESLDAILVFGEHEDAGSAPMCLDTWFTNDRPGMTVLFPKTGEPFSLAPFVLNHRSSDCDDVTAWIPDGNVRLGRHAGALGELLNDLATATIGVVGVEPYGPWHPDGVASYGFWESVRTQFPAVEFRMVGKAFAQLVAPLSAEEVAVVRYSAEIGDAMVQAMVETAGPGVPENLVYAAGMAAAHERGTVVPMMMFESGPSPIGAWPPQWAFRPQAPRVLQAGDVLRAEVFCSFGMRATQHQVMMAVGDVHQDFERAADVARKAYDAGLEVLRAGRTFGEVVDEMRKPVDAAGGMDPGYGPGQPLIHSLNPFGLRGGGMATANGDTELVPGMTFAFEPYCNLAGRKVTLGGTVIVGDDEPIELNPSSAQLLRAQG